MRELIPIPHLRQHDRDDQCSATSSGLESMRLPVKTLSWTLLAAITIGTVLLFNYWASFQVLSTLVYSGIVEALFGLANLAFPFRFLGIRKRAVGALMLVGGVALALTALFWPARMLYAAQTVTVLDEIMPEYQFYERHSIRIHALPGPAMHAVRESTWGDLKSLITLLKIRGAVLRTPYQDTGAFASDKRVFDMFASPGSLVGGSEHELVMAWGANLQAKRPLEVRTLREFADYRQHGAVKMCMNFNVQDAGGGWSTVTSETRVLALLDSTRGVATYWRLIVPGSGLLRRQWLDGIKRRAESEH